MNHRRTHAHSIRCHRRTLTKIFIFYHTGRYSNIIIHSIKAGQLRGHLKLFGSIKLVLVIAINTCSGVLGTRLPLSWSDSQCSQSP